MVSLPARVSFQEATGGEGQLVPLATALFRCEPAAVRNEWHVATADE